MRQVDIAFLAICLVAQLRISLHYSIFNATMLFCRLFLSVISIFLHHLVLRTGSKPFCLCLKFSRAFRKQSTTLGLGKRSGRKTMHYQPTDDVSTWSVVNDIFIKKCPLLNQWPPSPFILPMSLEIFKIFGISFDGNKRSIFMYLVGREQKFNSLPKR